MSDTEDHPEREDHTEHQGHSERDTEETQHINFEWTPELVKIGTSRGTIHPSIGPIPHPNGFADCNYRPGMTLPDPSDTQECLRWVGLADKKVIELEQKFNELYPDFQAPRCGYDNDVSCKGISHITFPLIEKMVDLFIQETYNDKEAVEHTHKAYIEKGIQLGLQPGLQPEFAIFCGLHKDDPRAIAKPDLFEELWFIIKSPADLIEDTIIPFWMYLKEFMATKLLHDGKAWSGYGRWVVREGETIDQAKARVDDRERQRLKEQAIKEHEARLERQQEDRLEAEMLQQQSIDQTAQ